MIDKFFEPISNLIGKAQPDKIKRKEIKKNIKKKKI